MKRFSILFTIFLIGIPFAACKKNSTGPNGGGSSVVMTAIVNGKSWNGIIPGYGTINGYPYIDAGDDSSVISLYYIQSDTGTFDVGGPGDSLYMTYFLHTTNYNSIPHSGKVRFTTNTASRAAGTFSFRAVDPSNDTVTVTGGTFNNPQ